MKSFHELFDKVKEQCKSELMDVPYSLWIKDIEALSFENSTAVLSVKTEFKRSIIEEKYLDLIARNFEQAVGFPVTIQLVSEEESPLKAPSEEVPTTQMPGGDYEYTFSTFIIGPSNKFAHAASLAVATNPAGSYNPLFIYGGSGLGKTHLLCAICSEINQTNPNFKIIYVKGEEFMNELIAAIGAEKTKEFHDKYRQADVLLVDDIQFIGGKEATQEEFFHTFNALYHSGRQIVLTSDRPPKEIKTLEDRLRTRFESGLLADVSPPDFETRIAIIRRKAELLGFSLPDDVIEYIATRLKNNIRQLEGAVKKLRAYKMLADLTPSIATAQSAIRDILNDSQPISVTVDKIISEVSRYYEVSPADIRSSKRAAQISLARQASMYIIREVTQMSMASIGEEFGGRDHSTVVYAIGQVEKNLENDSYFKNTIEDIIKNVRNS